jgi:hypothetical protein
MIGHAVGALAPLLQQLQALRMTPAVYSKQEEPRQAVTQPHVHCRQLAALPPDKDCCIAANWQHCLVSCHIS